MNAEIIAIGTELLIGQIANTNAQYLSKKCNDLGLGVFYHTVVGDNMDRVLEILKIALTRSQYIFVTGGLGPTEDDITRDAISKFAKVPLKEDSLSKEKIIEYFQKKNTPMSPNNLKQALLPEGSTILYNNFGTAPGFILTLEDHFIISLPGPPQEMQSMFEGDVIPNLFPQSQTSISSKFIKVFGLGESFVEEKIMDLVLAQTSPTIATYAALADVTIRLTAKNYLKSGDEIFEPVLSEIKKRLDPHIYSTENEALNEVVAKLLLKNNTTISTAESCTGGLLAKSLTDIAGISEVYHTGFVTYSNQSKMKSLGVSSQTLEKYGAVSGHTALEMAIGTRLNARTDISISITGIAGPGGGTEEKPVGLVYIGFSSGKNSFARELRLTGSRDKIRNLTTLHALNIIREYLLAN
jgi:nicotinamide-nucleotide amidase